MYEKKCFKCSVIYPISEFYKHSRMADGHLNKCKECTKKDATDNRWNKVEYYREYDRNRPNRAGAYEYMKKYRKDNPEIYRAHQMVALHVKKGNMTIKPCEICGTTERIEGHHDDYSKPLDVRWLCSVHHKEYHRNLKESTF